MRYGSVQNAEIHLFCSENRNFYIKLQAQHRDILNATLANKKVSTKKKALTNKYTK